jgi:hypothetical protein
MSNSSEINDENHHAMQISSSNHKLPEDVIQILLSRATYPVFDDEPMKRCGRIFKFGKCYSEWNHQHEILPNLQEWAELQGLGHCNSIVIQVYDKPECIHNFHLFYNDCRALYHSTLVENRFTEGKVTSLWFALREEDKNNDNILATSSYKSLVVRIKDGFRVEFDAFNDEVFDNYKMIQMTLKPCLNIIFRRLVDISDQI